MAQQEVAKVVVRDFAGLRTNRDPDDVTPGESRQQVNVNAERQGELRPRQGWVRVKFEQ